MMKKFLIIVLMSFPRRRESKSILQKKCLWLLLTITLAPSICFAKLLPIQHWQTKQGGKVYFVASHSLPMVDIAVLFNAGSIHDGKYPGLANLTNSMFAKTADGDDATEIATDFAKVGAVFNNSASRDFAYLSLRSLTEKNKLNSAVKTFSKVMTEAEFPSDNFDRVKKQILITLKGQNQDSAKIATQKILATIYGNSPYAHNVLGTHDSVDDIDRSEVKDFYHQYYVEKNAKVIIVGDLTLTQAKTIATDLMAKLPKGNAAKSLPIPGNSNGKQHHFEFPSSQNHIRFGEITIDRKNKDYTALAVGNFILGDGFTSRLFQTIRDKHGLSYAVSSYLQPMRDHSLFMISLQTKNQTRGKAIALVKATVKKFIADGPNNNELITAKRSINGRLPLLFDSNSSILSAVLLLAAYDLPLDYFDHYQQRVNAVTSNEIKSAWQKHISLKHLSTISVGGN